MNIMKCDKILTGVLFGIIILFPSMVVGQEEVTSSLRRYKAYEMSTGYYEEYEVLPRRQRPMISIREQRNEFPYSPFAAKVRNRSRLSDSHTGIKFYYGRRCESCHIEQTKDIHTVRANLTCRQCHGAEPIASINHYYSPMNPIRRHAYVCSKCHEGASASFATYLVHEPPAHLASTKKSFPALYYTYWFMLILLTVTLVFFIPHSILASLRELFNRKKNYLIEKGETIE